MKNVIKEQMMVHNGKMKYCIMMKQEKNEVCVYIDSKNEIEFSSNRYYDLIVFDLGNEVHRIAKELFLTHLQTEVKAKLLDLKQLELILGELGLIGVIRKTLVDNGSMLIDQKDDIIEESVKRSSEIIKEVASETAEKVVNEQVIGLAKKRKKL